MQTNVVRQPILNRENDIIGYEVLYQQDLSSTYNQMDGWAANMVEDVLLSMDTGNYLEGKNTYITFTPNLLLKNIPKMFDPKKLIIQIEDTSLVHPLAQKIIYRYKGQGYRVALKGFEFAPRFFQFLDVVDIIKVDFTKHADVSMDNVVTVARNFGKELIAYHVDTPEALDRAVSLGFTMLQGSAVGKALSTSVKHVDHLQSNFFHLIVAVSKDEPDLDEVAEIISRDVTLAFSLIKLVNSAYFALKNRASSVKQALIILGLGQLKQWVYLLSFKNKNGSEPSELIKISFLRANFCAELSQYVPNMPVSKNEAYLLGMFSTLDSLMGLPLDKVLEELPISDMIKDGLLTGEGKCGLLYNLVLCYENADWKGMTAYAAQLGVPVNAISPKYLECVESVNSIWRALNDEITEEL